MRSSSHPPAGFPLGWLLSAVAAIAISACTCGPTGDRPARVRRSASSSLGSQRPAQGSPPATSADLPPPRPGYERRVLPDGLLPMTARSLAQRIVGRAAEGTIVNAWASWCGPCRRELPMLVQMQANYPKIELVLVSMDEPDKWERALEVLREVGAPLPAYVVVERLGEFKAALNPRWQGMIPATFLFDGRGKLRYWWGGPVYDTELFPLLDRYLAGEHIDGEAVFGLAPGKLME